MWVNRSCAVRQSVCVVAVRGQHWSLASACLRTVTHLGDIPAPFVLLYV